ncbi:MAG: hypothetical protein IJ419_07395 [Agathobacter sp.]|nr:hypothetical protein [Agathobacter sp.]
MIDLIEIIFDIMEGAIFDEPSLDWGLSIIALAGIFFIMSVKDFILLLTRESRTLFQTKFALIVCLVSGIISIGGGILYYNSIDRSEMIILRSATVEYNEAENEYELVGYDFPDGNYWRLEIDEKLVKRIGPDDKVLNVTYDGKRNPQVIYVTPFPKVEDTNPTS